MLLEKVDPRWSACPWVELPRVVAATTTTATAATSAATTAVEGVGEADGCTRAASAVVARRMGTLTARIGKDTVAACPERSGRGILCVGFLL